jgi:hypothetical protein
MPEIQRAPRRHGTKVGNSPTPERYQAFIRGEIDISDLDDEEVQRMQLRSADGSFRGRPPGVIPREFILALKREQQVRFQAWIDEAVPAAQRAILELVNSKRLQPGDATRLKAAQEIIDRFAGKVSDNVNISAEVTTWEANKDLIYAAEIVNDATEEDDEFTAK